MRKTLFISAVALMSSINSFGQIINRCMTPEAIQYQESLTPGFIHQVNTIFNNAHDYTSNSEAKANSIYTIPVVVHIVYNTPEQNLPDSVILNQIDILTADYNRWNADTVNMRSDFDIVKGSPQIEFKLAQIDANGLSTDGITRTQTSTASFGSLALVGGDFSDLEKVKSTVDGGEDPWDQNRYLNIWVCNMSVNFFGTEITALLGYATPPAGLSNWPAGSTANLSDGVVIQFQAFGSNNPNPLDAGGGPIDVRGRTVVHEVGHYLGLRHIWGDGDCLEEDGIDDTPNADAQSDSDCDPSKNTCVDNIQGIDLPDMIENYMDYSAESCQNSFTQGQVDLMHGVLEAERYDLVYGNPASLIEQTDLNWIIYPNPSEGILTVSTSEDIDKIEIVSISGRVVKSINEVQSVTTIDLSHFEGGTYFVNISSNAYISSKRIVLL
ncbi:MAG: zinc-dependent metalloprotease [Crocinitomicaceae bacterium]|nr:zinc-dependent metalloprotease [Crocinitomicaceae bacterium]